MIVYLRFKKACKAQGVTQQDFPYHNKWFQPWGAYVSRSCPNTQL
jgi:amino acid transporter